MPRRDVVPRRGEAKVAEHLERREEHRQRRTARRHLREVALVQRVRRRRDEPRDELVVVLRGDAAVRLAHADECARVAPEPLPVAALVRRVEELVEEAPPAHAVAQARLVLGTHEQHLLDEELRVVRVVPAAEPEEQVDLVDAREVAGVRAAVLLAPDAVGLVVGAHAVEEAVDVELGEEHVVEPPRRPRALGCASSKSVSATACEIPIGAIRLKASAARMYPKIPRVL